MKYRKGTKGATLGAAALSTIVLPTGVSEAQSDQTQVRFLHAVAGAGPAALYVEKGRPQLPSSFAKPSGYQIYRPGEARLRLILNGQDKPVATEVVRLGPGKHTVVAVGGDNGVDLLIYRDNGVEPGKATLRAIHAATEVGRADVQVDGEVVVTGVGLGDATGYLPVPPGRHSVAVTRPGGDGGALVRAQVRAVAGTASTAFVVGSAGMPAQVVLADDAVAAPATAPATGLGGATSDGGWLLIGGSAVLGGALGGASYVLARRTRTRGTLHVASPAPLAAAPPPPAAAEADAASEDATPSGGSSVAAGPVVAAGTAAEEPAEDPSPVVAPAQANAAPGGNGAAASNGQPAPNGQPEAEQDWPMSPAPVVWAPPAGERWAEQPSSKTPRFIRPDPEGPAPTQLTPEQPEAGVQPVAARPAAEPAAVNGPAADAGSEATVIPEAPHAETTETVTPDAVTAPPEPAASTAPPAAEPEAAPSPFDPPASPAEPSAEAPEPVAPIPVAPIPVPPASWRTPWGRPPAATEPPEADRAGEPEPATGETVVPDAVFPEAAREAEPKTEPAAEAETAEAEQPTAPAPEVLDKPEAFTPEVMLEPVPDTVEPAEQSEPPAPAPVVSTWSSTPARPATATSRAHRVNFLVVSGAALVVTGLVVARRGGRR